MIMRDRNNLKLYYINERPFFFGRVTYLFTSFSNQFVPIISKQDVLVYCPLMGVTIMDPSK